MNRKDNRFNNMGPRLDLGSRPPAQKPPTNPPRGQTPYNQPLGQQQPPYHQQSQPSASAPYGRSLNMDNRQNHPQAGMFAPNHPEHYDSDFDMRYDTQPLPSGWRSGHESQEYTASPGMQEDNLYHDPRMHGEAMGNSYQPPDNRPFYYGDEGYYDAPPPEREAVAMAAAAPAAQRGLSRLVSWLALLVALLAVGMNLFFTPSPATMAPDALEVMDGAVPGATAERVAKLEKDVSSLLLKMVSLEKDLESLQNRNLTPAKVTELTNKMVALQNQLNDLNARVGSRSSTSSSSTSATGGNNAAASSPGQPAGRTAAAQPDKPATSSSAATAVATGPAAQSGQGGGQSVAGSQVEDRAGSKPDPLATRMAGTANPAATPSGSNQPAGRPRASYTVVAGDTLFGIAQRYKVTTSQLMAWNNMKDSDVIKPGKVLVIY